jgi:hypothetical protein
LPITLRHPGGHARRLVRLAVNAGEAMFSIIVKSKPFTKHIGCQSAALESFSKAK